MARLPVQLPNVRWTAIRHSSERTKFEGFENVFVDQAIGNFIDYATGAKLISKAFKTLGTPDLFHSFFHVVPKRVRAPFVCTLHDTIWIDHANTSQPTKFKAATIRAFASRAIPDTLRRAEKVICVSNATAERAQQWIDADKTTTVSHGVDARFFEASKPEEIVKNLRRDEARYIVAIGNDKPYKNLRRLIDAFLAIDPKQNNLRLALIGPCSGLRQHARQKPNGERIWFLGKLNDSDLQAVLKNSDVFVFPSLVEGFGLPILEAMASGVPTIVSDIEPMRSVAGNAAFLFDAKNIEALTESMRAALDPKAAIELKNRGLKRARSLTWEKTVDETIAVYESVLGLF